MPEPGLVITRIFDAQRELVRKAWINPQHAMQWREAKGFTNSSCDTELKVGGKFNLNTRVESASRPGDAGYTTCWGVAPERLAAV